jgi:hypothetical protein
LAEVYLWNFKGKITDLEALSSQSLFELEVASPLIKGEPEVHNTPIKGPSNEQKRIDVNQRIGRVFSYSQNSNATKQPNGQPSQGDEVHYRLRHLNTGRLVIDQEIDINGITMRTLGLAPHLVAKNLHNLSDKLVESVGIDLKELGNPNNYIVEKDVDGFPKNYEELDKRSRFRIITTSPSLDTRIKSNSCVQI